MKRLTVAFFLFAAACAPDLREDYPFDGQVNTGPLVRVEAREDGSQLVRVDASNKGARVYVDLEEGRELKADEAFATNAWDLSFQRYEVTMNGGGGNPEGKVSVAVLKDVPYASLQSAPAGGYQQDASEPVFASVDGGWYAYDLSQHKLAPRPELLYVVKSSEGRFYKLRMLGYYDETGTPGHVSFQYQPLAAP